MAENINNKYQLKTSYTEEQKSGKPLRFIDSVNFAIEGIIYAVSTEKHMRWHFTSAAFILLISIFLKVTHVEFALLAMAICLVLCAELINTAIEAVVDLVSPDFHPLARVAKDVAAGGVLVTAFSAGVMGYIILSRYLFNPYRRLLQMIGPPNELAILTTLITVVILVVVVKALFGKGTPLEGGLPSGHSAVSFAAATLVTLHTADPLISIITIMMAVMVSHSRLLLRIHSVKEVVLGAAMGIAVASVMVYLFRYL